MNLPTLVYQQLSEDLKIDLQDIESLLEELDCRLTRVENKEKKTRAVLKLTDRQKTAIGVFLYEATFNAETIITTKGILEYLELDPNHQGLQQQVACLLKAENLTKVRKRIGNKLTYVWSK